VFIFLFRLFGCKNGCNVRDDLKAVKSSHHLRHRWSARMCNLAAVYRTLILAKDVRMEEQLCAAARFIIQTFV